MDKLLWFDKCLLSVTLNSAGLIGKLQGSQIASFLAGFLWRCNLVNDLYTFIKTIEPSFAIIKFPKTKDYTQLLHESMKKRQVTFRTSPLNYSWAHEPLERYFDWWNGGQHEKQTDLEDKMTLYCYRTSCEKSKLIGNFNNSLTNFWYWIFKISIKSLWNYLISKIVELCVYTV
jgi:hypothetical protein